MDAEQSWDYWYGYCYEYTTHNEIENVTYEDTEEVE